VSCDCLFDFLKDSESLSEHHPWIGSYVFMEWQQLQRHLHGIVFASLSVTMRMMRAVFPAIRGPTVEPVRCSPAACLRYMPNQATGRVVYYPDETVMTWFEHATATFERRVSSDLQGP
jgi:hypothetical protein